MKLNGLENYFETVNGKIVDFTQVDKDGYTPLLFSFLNNKEEKLNLNNKKIILKAVRNNGLALKYVSKELKNDKDGYAPLMYALVDNFSAKLNLNHEQWKYMIENSNLSLIKKKEHLLKLKRSNQNCLMMKY